MTPRTVLRVPRILLASVLALGGLGLAAPLDAQGSPEARTAAYLASIRDRTPQLIGFLREMPKGGDLHNHLSGAVYAESFLRWAAQDSLCVVVSTLSLTRSPCTPTEDSIPAAAAMYSSSLYGQLIDAWSMRNWNPARPKSGHDQFFDTFGKFGATERRTGDMLAEATSRAASGRLSYMELMSTLDGSGSAGLGAQVGYDSAFGVMRDRLLAAGLRDTAAKARRSLTRVEARRDTVLGCGTAQADPGCAVTVRWIYQVSRGRQPAQVYAQILMGFEMASTDPRVVGFNLVQPEDGLVSMRDFSLQMRMIQYLRGLYPNVRPTLHAGELAPGLVPPEGLRFHIRESVRVAGARRIGHGVDIMNEDSALALLREMAERRVMVEIALTSNAVILGVAGRDHPLHVYLAHGVPVALATDDEGVARSEMTMEYVRAVQEQELDYRTLKMMARNSLEYAFVEGASLWSDARRFVPVAACAAGAGGLGSRRCQAFTAGSVKARLQAELERGFEEFERRPRP
ncbi:MAG TPA: hypothetical protein VEW03_10675 [Longimicrobiaceae bacterium]|nr:hypothetical protein [Longimicrobiaceae bacterium]